METLGFGSHLMIDGFLAKAERLADRQHLTDSLVALAQQLEPDAPLLVTVPTDDGLSGLAVLAESHVAIHAFVPTRTVVVDIFSRREISSLHLIAEVKEAFAVGRAESHLSPRAKLFSHRPAEAARQLVGERSYAAARLAVLAE